MRFTGYLCLVLVLAMLLLPTVAKADG